MLSPAEIVTCARWAGRAQAYFEKVELGERLDRLRPTGAADREMSQVRMLAGRHATAAWESTRQALESLGASLSGAPPHPMTAEARRRFRADVIARMRPLVVDRDLSLLDVAAPIIDAFGALGLAETAAELRSGPAERFLLDEIELQLMRIADAAESVARAIERASAAFGPERASPAVAEALVALRSHFAGTPRPGEAPSKKRLDTWRRGLDERCRVLSLALGFPPEPLSLAPPSAEELALLARIPQEPGNMDLRDAFAALAIERGDPRGFYVREGLRMRTSMRGRELFDFERSYRSPLTEDLERRHPEWTRDILALGATAAKSWGGFVEEIAIDAGVFLDAAPRLFAIAPIRSAKIACSPAELPRLLASPWLSRLVALDLSHDDLESGDVEKLAASPGLEGLRMLDLSHNRISAEGVFALARSSRLPRLAHVGLDGNPCGPLYTTELTHQEMSTFEWVRTDLCIELEAAVGSREWFRPWRGRLPLDALGD